MKKLLILLLLFISTPALADLNYVTYAAGGATPCQGCGTVLSSGTVANINYDWGGGQVLNSGRADGVSVRFTGYITIPGNGSQTITFYNRSDDGFVLKVGGTTVINNWREQGPASYNSSGSITLVGGQTYAIDVWYYENGGGAVAQLYWNQTGAITLLPNSSFLTTQPNPRVFGDGGASLPAAAISQTQTNTISQTTTIANSAIYIENYGYGNTVTIEQFGNNNAIRGTNGNPRAVINGDYNSIIVKQGQQYSNVNNSLVEMSVIGSSNTIALDQKTSGNYIQAGVSGNSNNIGLTQKGTNGKNAFLNITGGSNVVALTQDGNGNHFVDLNLPTNGNNVSLTQNGNAQKVFSLTINTPNVGVTISQINPNASDSASMAITCNVGPCTGYSYTRN